MKSLLPEFHEIDYLPESIRAKHIDVLLDVRAELEVKMMNHVDEYNGFCGEKEEMVTLRLDYDGYTPLQPRYS